MLGKGLGSNKQDDEFYEILKRAAKELKEDSENIKEMSEMFNIDKSKINIIKHEDFPDLTVYTLGDPTKEYNYHVKGSEAIKIMIQFALDTNNIEPIREILQGIIDHAELLDKEE